VCETPVRIRPDGVTISGDQAYYRCPACEASFVIRWEDALALGVAPPDEDAHEHEDAGRDIASHPVLHDAEPASSVWRDLAGAIAGFLAFVAMLGLVWAFWFWFPGVLADRSDSETQSSDPAATSDCVLRPDLC
jgi:hypothetical protein